MFYLEKKMQVSASHRLPNYDGACANLHGHNWNITVTCRCKDDELNDQGMVLDFTEIKKIVNQLDHTDINALVENPTAENIAKWLAGQIPHCHIIEVEETDGNKIMYFNEESLEATQKKEISDEVFCEKCGAKMMQQGPDYICAQCGSCGGCCA